MDKHDKTWHLKFYGTRGSTPVCESGYQVYGENTTCIYFTDHPYLTAVLMTIASGGILYLLIQDIIPESKLENNYLTSLGATLGFVVGIIEEKII